jgi:diguanylate cyclase (GGDEF)-like protein
MNAARLESGPRPHRVTLLTTVAALVLAVLMVVSLEAVKQRDAHLNALAAQAGIVAGNSSAALVFGDRRSAREVLATLDSVSDVLAATLYDKNGQSFVSYTRTGTAGNPDATAPETLDANESTRAIGWTKLSVVQSVKAGGHREGALWIAATRASDWWHLLWYALTMLLVAGASLFGAYALLTRVRRGAVQVEEVLAWRAHHDPVSGLPNRYLFLDRLEQALARARRSGTQVALIYFDLDNFKGINDTLGHDAGDAALRETARRASARLRASDTVARMSGDEFALLIEPLNDPAHAQAVAQQMMDSLNLPYELNGRQVFVGASMGIAIFAADGENGEALLRAADTAMYFAKGRGRNNIQFYTSALNETLEKRLEFQSRLRHALLHDELEMHYQPVVALDGGHTVALEALLRWRQPERGLLVAREFLAGAEEAGMAHLIGEAALRLVCQDRLAWRDAGRQIPPLAVNLSAAHLIRPEAVPGIVSVLERHGARPADIEIEISEHALHMQSDELLRALEDLKRRGFRLTVDDFGTGFVSLRSLKRIATGRVKIDGSVIAETPADADSATFVRAILALGRSLGFDVVAKGVETEAQVAFLRAEGCALAQGYYFSRPLPPTEVRLEEDSA